MGRVFQKIAQATAPRISRKRRPDPEKLWQVSGRARVARDQIPARSRKTKVVPTFRAVHALSGCPSTQRRHAIAFLWNGGDHCGANRDDDEIVPLVHTVVEESDHDQSGD